MKSIYHPLIGAALLCLPCELGAAETCVSSAALEDLSFDFSQEAVRTLEKASDVLSVAYNNNEAWPRGGDSTVALATLTVTTMSAEGGDRADPSTWTAEKSVTLPVAAFEGTVVWEPTTQGLYRITLAYASSETEVANFDLLDLVFERKDVATLAVDPISDVTYTGEAQTPTVTLRDGAKVLERDVDYTLVYENNLYEGQGRITVTGIGDYAGTRVITFAIAYAVVSSDGPLATDLDLRETLSYTTKAAFLPFAYNDSSLWPAGGLSDGVSKARVTCAPKASADAEPDESARIVLFERTGEGVKRTGRSGLRNYRIEFLDENGEVVDSLSRDIDTPLQGLQLLVR